MTKCRSLLLVRRKTSVSAQCSVTASRHCKHFLNALLYILSLILLQCYYATKFEVKKGRSLYSVCYRLMTMACLVVRIRFSIKIQINICVRVDDIKIRLTKKRKWEWERKGVCERDIQWTPIHRRKIHILTFSKIIKYSIRFVLENANVFFSML